MELLLLYNKTLNKHVTALFCLYLGNVDTSANHFRNAPVGGHTCLTAGEQGEPADWGLQLCFSIGPRRRTHNNWIYYKLLNLSCCFPPHISVRTATIWLLWVLLRGPIHSFACSQPPQVHCVHPRLGKCALLRGQCTHNHQLLFLFFVCLRQWQLSGKYS